MTVADLVQPEQERGDDAEVAAAAADAPRTGPGARRRSRGRARRSPGRRRPRAGCRSPGRLARQVPEPAAEREAADAGGRDDPARRREAVLARRAVDLAPGAAAADADRPGLRVDVDVLASARGRSPRRRRTCPARRRCGRRRGRPAAGRAPGRSVTISRDVVRAGAAGDQRRPLVDHRVVDLARLVVVGVVGPISRPRKPGSSRRAACAGVVIVLMLLLGRDGRERRYGPRARPVMTRADRLLIPRAWRAGGDHESDLTIVAGRRHATTSPARCAPPRRSRSSGARPSWSTLRTLLPRAEGEGRRVVLLGGEPGSGKSRLVREFAVEAAGERRARPLRRLRRGRAHALRAVRRGARPPRAGRSSRPSCGRRSARRAAS